MTPNFCKTHFDMQGVEILEEKKENKVIEPIIIVED